MPGLQSNRICPRTNPVQGENYGDSLLNTLLNGTSVEMAPDMKPYLPANRSMGRKITP